MEEPRQRIDPCNPSPCGPYSQCRANGEQASCTCLEKYIGSPPNCRPECVTSNECPNDKACLQERCSDPCPGSCGYNAHCNVINHAATCTCDNQFTGDPFSQCYPIPVAPPVRTDPCNPSPCGSNAVCTERYGTGSCQCLPEYFGDPYTGCRPECVTNNDCPSNKACQNQKCVDPCPGVCGINAECAAVNHNAICTCILGHVGNPFYMCRRQEIPPPPRYDVKRDPCNPSPCGPYSQCREVSENAICTCLPTYVGSPPNCRPECVQNSDCPNHLACIQEKCRGRVERFNF